MLEKAVIDSGENGAEQNVDAISGTKTTDSTNQIDRYDEEKCKNEDSTTESTTVAKSPGWNFTADSMPPGWVKVCFFVYLGWYV